MPAKEQAIAAERRAEKPAAHRYEESAVRAITFYALLTGIFGLAVSI